MCQATASEPPPRLMLFLPRHNIVSLTFPTVFSSTTVSLSHDVTPVSSPSYPATSCGRGEIRGLKPWAAPTNQ
jgi:hypothetical protein